MHIKINTQYKSLKVGKEVELPDFCILTGKNGSGKSHFLSSLTQQNVADVTINSQKITLDKIRYIPFNGLNPKITTDCTKDIINQKVLNFWNCLLQLQRNANQQNLTEEQKDIRILNLFSSSGNEPALNAAYKIAATNLSKRFIQFSLFQI